MLTITLRFPGGRFHATPWGRHVNEGAVELPPSPWRLCRAIIAIWRRKCQDIDESLVREIVKIVGTPPAMHVPFCAPGHTRHYMPKYRSSLDGKTGKVFDAFVRMDRSERMIMHWPTAYLTAPASEALDELLSAMTYFGRAESWVEMASTTDPPAGDLTWRPMESDVIEEENVVVLCLEDSDLYGSWATEQRDTLTAEILEEKKRKATARGKDAAGVKLTRKEQEKVAGLVPEDIFECLQLDTADIQAGGWRLPPGSREVRYRLPERAVDRSLVMPTVRASGAKPTVARFALASDTISADTRPRMTRGLYLAETIRQALMSLAKDEKGQTSWIFSGKTEGGKPLSGHRHAYYLPCDDDDDGRIDHIAVFARDGFGAREQSALMKLRKLWQHKNAPDLFTVLLSMGTGEQFEGVTPSGGSSCLGRARAWISRTPYIAARHPKKNGKDSIAEQVRRELANHGLPDPISITYHANGTRMAGKPVRWTAFARIRTGGGSRPAMTQGCGLRIEFATEVLGPIALGYGSHFGLGLFVPE